MNDDLHTAPDDERFLAAIADASLAPADFDHRAHLRLAWLLLRRHPVDEAAARLCDAIAHYAAAHGVPGKFHRTVTEALLRLMAAAGAPGDSLEDVLRTQPLLLADARALLARYYSAERLAAPEARLRFLPPDRRPLTP